MENSTLKIENFKINFRCKLNECLNSCCGPFEGIHNNIKNLDKRPFDEIVLTKDDYKTIKEEGYEFLTEEVVLQNRNIKYIKMSLEQDGTCKAFENGKCSINNFKPTLCRAFPFYFDMFSGLCAIMCEGFSDEYWSDLSDYEECFEAARKMYEFWIDFYTPKKEI